MKCKFDTEDPIILIPTIAVDRKDEYIGIGFLQLRLYLYYS